MIDKDYESAIREALNKKGKDKDEKNRFGRWNGSGIHADVL